jgi:hypothetical protein
MFAPIAAFPIGGALTTTPSTDAAVTGTITFTGLASGEVSVKGVGASTLDFAGGGVGTQGVVSVGSLLAGGAIGAGPIGAAAAADAGGAERTGQGAGTFTITGSVSSLAVITGRAPDIVTLPWRITAGDAAATIATYPAPPTEPAWNIQLEAPGFRVIDYPSYLGTVASVPFFDLGGSMTALIGAKGSADGAFPVGGAAAATVTVSAVGAGDFTVTLEAFGNPTARGVGASLFDLTGVGRGGVGILDLEGVAASEIAFDGSATMLVQTRADAAGDVTFTLEGTGSVTISGAFAGMFDVTGTGKQGQLSSARRASTYDSMNAGALITQQEFSRLIGG